MPALDKIENRLHDNLDWHASYNTNLASAGKIAEQIQIVHVLGNPSTFFSNFSSWPPTLSPTDDTNARSRPRTVKTEDAFNLGRCVYFYAGRAFPVSGGMAFAFSPVAEANHEGSVTPFDTGGLYCDDFFKPYIHMTPSKDAHSRKAFCQASMIPLAIWRKRFADFLAVYFSPLAGYWEGRPWKPDPDGILLHPQNTWQAWTFEVRFQEPHGISKVDFWCAKEDDLELFRRNATNALPAAYSAEFAKFLDRMLTPGQGTLNYCNLIEQEIRNRVSL